MAKVVFGVTASVAAIRTPDLLAALRQAGHDVVVVATKPSLYFFDPVALAPLQDSPQAPPRRNPNIVVLDDDEWPGRDAGRRYERTDKVLHIELRRWADVLVIAPLDANTLAKLAGGLSDNCLTCVWRAWDRARPVILAPAMNTLMWEHPLTARHLRQIAADATDQPLPADLELTDLVSWINAACAKLHIVPPLSKRLACDDVGIGAMAGVEEIVEAVSRFAAGRPPC